MSTPEALRRDIDGEVVEAQEQVYGDRVNLN